ncbi:MAG: hypothetical protein ACJAS3_002135 [Roseivirga sp.]|jgi:hypothetical protein
MNREYPSQLIEMGFIPFPELIEMGCIPFPCKSKPHGPGFSQNSLRLKHEVIDKPSEDIFSDPNEIYLI